jgi:coiled-coil domain-containing protein 130
MQGFNMGRYIPPELEGRVSFNKASGKGHALGARARKLGTEGILTVRFECPFAIWCTTCQPEKIIAQGVRFNAEKKKVGNYYSTPIWSFRFTHFCGGVIEVRTDPKASEYVVFEGARRRDYGEGRREAEWGMVAGATEEEKERLEKEGGFAKLEKAVDEKREKVTQQMRIDELRVASERDWADPYEKSRLLRREFRVGRRKRQDDGRTGAALQERFGFAVDMLETTDEDAAQARQIEFGPVLEVEEAARKPLFSGADRSNTDLTTSLVSQKARPTSSSKASRGPTQKTALQAQLSGATRAGHDPFLKRGDAWQPRSKRRRTQQSHADEVAPTTSEQTGNEAGSSVATEARTTAPPDISPALIAAPAAPSTASALVSYDSE